MRKGKFQSQRVLDRIKVPQQSSAIFCGEEFPCVVGMAMASTLLGPQWKQESYRQANSSGATFSWAIGESVAQGSVASLSQLNLGRWVGEERGIWFDKLKSYF